jgi:hypothetical protein
MSEHPAPQHGPEVFADIIAGKEKPLLVGGQAVNLWAQLYAKKMPELKTYRPFSSKDADIHGTRMLAQDLAKRTGWEFRPAKDPHSVALGALVKQTKGQPLVVEVLKEINGLSDTDLARNVEIATGSGRTYRVLPPEVLLNAKLYNLASFGGLNRPQDLKHVKILIEIVPRYLNELVHHHRAGAISRQDVANAVRYVADTLQEGASGNAIRAYQLDVSKVVPASVRMTERGIGATASNQSVSVRTSPSHVDHNQGPRMKL